MNKRHERFLVEEASKLLETKWTIGDDRENPDFLITDTRVRARTKRRDV